MPQQNMLYIQYSLYVFFLAAETVWEGVVGYSRCLWWGGEMQQEENEGERKVWTLHGHLQLGTLVEST